MTRSKPTAAALARPITDWAAPPDPAVAVIWRAPRPDSDEWPCPVVSIGTAGVLCGTREIGKRQLALQLALAAADAHTRADADYAVSAGLHVRAGPVIMIDYGTEPQHQREEAAKLLQPEQRGAQHIYIVPEPKPLYLADTTNEKTAGTLTTEWAATLWEQAAQIQPTLIIINPAPKAIGGTRPTDTTVRNFMDALTTRARAIGAGALLITLDTATTRTRKAKLKNKTLGRDAVAGPHAWYDRAGAVLHLAGDRNSTRRTVQSIKADQATTRWKIELTAREPNGRFEAKTPRPPDLD